MTKEQMRIALAKEMAWKPDPRNKGCWIPPGKRASSVHYFTDTPPNYPEDTNAALQVVEMMRAKGWSDSHFGTTWIFFDPAKGETIPATADTLPLAICESACKALGIYGPSKDA